MVIMMILSNASNGGNRGNIAFLDTNKKVLREYKGYALQSTNFPSLRENYGRFTL